MGDRADISYEHAVRSNLIIRKSAIRMISGMNRTIPEISRMARSRSADFDGLRT